ncbi:MAG: Glucose 1-dehydrogenase 2 [Candidatus Ordinivivax streblomastigis]|uniref:Glucose 1-dehydrogenase 2 n=1 Tax=Candidatus Ordinivivax streblomastigis TaxID=2540710 RepID=A0A5M8NUL2_9BACT|nr:MAG: Glucose 1-dehydrogenase 2 [Candidatus Ordinivivax streblomastigis]
MYLEQIFGLYGKTAIVTGGGRGIGQIIALGLAKAGAEIVIISRSGGQETVNRIEQTGGKSYELRADVTKENEVDEVLKTIIQRSGKVDILFNNAGICIHKDTINATIDEWRSVIDINLTGEYIMARAVGRHMIEQGIEGSIINMASMSGSIVNIPQWQASYNASKAGVIHMTKSLAAEWVGFGIRVNSLSPGYIATPMSADVSKELKEAWNPLIPMRRMGTPEELMPAVLYLTSPVANYTTGSDIIVDGGYVCI